MYVVAGGAGFLGSYFVDLLIDSGEDIFVIDNLLTGNIVNIKHHMHKSNFHFDACDIRNTNISELFVNKTINGIFNFASPASPPVYMKHALLTMESNSIGVQNLLNIAKEHNALFFQASTSEVYGDPLIHPQAESYYGNVNCYGERSMYDEGKRYAETLIKIYHEEFGVNTRIARIFNTYGPRMDMLDGRVIPTLICQAIKNKPMTVYGGSQTRSFCYVTDLIDGISKLCFNSEIHNPINIGNPHEITIIELAQTIKTLINSSSDILVSNLPKDDPIKRKPDITQAINKLGWSPIISLDDGLRHTISYYLKLTSSYSQSSWRYCF